MKTAKKHPRQRLTLSHYARLYCRWGASGRREVGSNSARNAFMRELTLGSRRQMPMLSLLKRMGWRRGRALTPEMVHLLEKKFGDPL